MQSRECFFCLRFCLHLVVKAIKAWPWSSKSSVMRYDECQKLVSAADKNAKPETKNFFAQRMFACRTLKYILFKTPREYQTSVTKPFAPQTSALIRSKKFCFRGKKSWMKFHWLWFNLHCDRFLSAKFGNAARRSRKLLFTLQKIKVVIKIYPKLRSPASLICSKTTRN